MNYAVQLAVCTESETNITAGTPTVRGSGASDVSWFDKE